MQYSHEQTPEELAKINQELEILFSQEDLDSDALAEVVERRDHFIKAYLNKLSPDRAKQFAEAELPINQKLTEQTKQHQADVLKQISNFLRGRKSVQKYKASLKNYK